MLWAICFCVGAAFLCLSPGNFTRTDAALPLYNHLLSFARLRVFWILVLSWCLFSRRTVFLRQNYLLLIALSVQMLFMFYAGFRNSRVLWGTELFSLILLLRLFTDFEKKRFFSWVTYALLTLLTIHFGWLIYRSGEVRQQYDEVIALYMESPDGIVYNDLHPESDWSRSFIPTPLCYYRPFELTCISVCLTKEQKPLHIYPKAMKSMEKKACFAPEAVYIILQNMEPVDIHYQKRLSLNPRYSSLSHVIGQAIRFLWNEEMTESYTPVANYDASSDSSFYVAQIPQDFAGQVSNVRIVRK
jgi:hypothetical protein